MAESERLPTGHHWQPFPESLQMSSLLELGVLPEAVAGSAWCSQDTRNTVSLPSEQRVSGRPPSLRLCPTALLTWTQRSVLSPRTWLRHIPGTRAHAHNMLCVCMQHTKYTQVDLVTSKETYWTRGPFMSPDIFYIRKNLQSSSPRCQSLNGAQSGEDSLASIRNRCSESPQWGRGSRPNHGSAPPTCLDVAASSCPQM